MINTGIPENQRLEIANGLTKLLADGYTALVADDVFRSGTGD